MQIYSPPFCPHSWKSWPIWATSMSSSHHLVSRWAWIMVENVSYPGIFPGEKGITKDLGSVPQQKVTAPARWSSSPRYPHVAPVLAPLGVGWSRPPSPLSLGSSLSLMVAFHTDPTCINNRFIKLSSNYPTWVYHFFPARTATDTKRTDEAPGFLWAML